MTPTWSRETVATDRVRVVLWGEIDVAAEEPLVAEVDAVIAESDAIVVELDLGAVEFIDSSGLRALLQLHRAHGERVVLGARSEPVQRVLEIAGLTDELNGDGGPA